MENQVEKKYMNIVDEDGSIEKVEVVLAFEFKDNGNKYIVYTKNERDKNGNYMVYVSYVNRETGEDKLDKVPDSEWDRVKDVLRELSKIEDETEAE